MKRVATIFVGLIALAAVAGTASAALRSAQVPVLGGSLQAYLNSVGESINVLTDQDATTLWSHTVSGTASWTLQLEASPNANANNFGIYNGSDASPALNLLIAAVRNPQSFSTGTFKPGNILVVNRFDEGGSIIGTQTFPGVDPTGFGFYLQGPNGTFYTQDARNPGGKAQALAFRGTGAGAAGTWWLCWD